MRFVRAFAALLLALCAVLVHAASADEVCRRQFNERIAACATSESARPGRNPSDFSFWQTCEARHRPEFERCVAQRRVEANDRRPAGCPDAFVFQGGDFCVAYNMSPAFCQNHGGRYVAPAVPGAPPRCEVSASRSRPGPAVVDLAPPSGPMNSATFEIPSKAPEQRWKDEYRDKVAERAEAGCPWSEARLGIDWVMSRDAGARRTFLNARERGLTCYQAVLAAQGHNPNAQSTIRMCGAAAERYIDSQPLCIDTVATRPRNPVPQANAPGGNSPVTPPAYAEGCYGVFDKTRGQIGWLEVQNQCDGPVTIVACFVWENGVSAKRVATVSGRKSPVSTPASVWSIPTPWEAQSFPVKVGDWCIYRGTGECRLGRPCA